MDKESTVLKLYKEGLKIKDICRIVSCYKDYPTIVAKKHGVSRGSGRNNTQVLDLTNKDHLYILGLIITDGSVFVGNRNSTVIVATKEESLADYVCKEIGFKKYKRKQNNIFTAQLGSKFIVDQLISMGITPNKSKTLELKIDLNWHILRGIFDGDGSIHNKRYCIKITSASKVFLEQVYNFLLDNGIESKIRRRNGFDYYDLWIENKKNYTLFFERVYNDPSKYYLEYKYQRFVALLGDEYEKLGKYGEGCDS
ncbi:LAGLIDADG DNA endonuclease family protein [Leptolyngbya phage Lbo-JY46]